MFSQLGARPSHCFGRLFTTRSLVFTAFLVFVALGLASPVLILFGVADLAGAVSTYVTSRGEHAAA